MKKQEGYFAFRTFVRRDFHEEFNDFFDTVVLDPNFTETLTEKEKNRGQFKSLAIQWLIHCYMEGNHPAYKNRNKEATNVRSQTENLHSEEDSS